MDANLQKTINEKIKNTIENLEKNGMKAVYVPSRTEALALLKTMLIPGETIAVGGSITLSEIGAMDLIQNGNYDYIDRYEKGISDKERDSRLQQGLMANTFLMSSNAITESGFLYNVDGTSNRVTALTFGPERVIVFAGYNKIVPDITSAITRVKTVAAPANAIRLGLDTYCTKHGHCMKMTNDPQTLMCLPAGACEHTICCNSVITGNQRVKNRITVVLIGEQLGY